ncbi:MAG TPA: hypothetical protein VLX44_09370 [Xanthobacteraceae bacterium]|nr:hypothetical protein [Xanthobacteraceae bacterium]
MQLSKIILAAAALAGVLATTAARAEEIRDVEERHAMYLDTTGKMHVITFNDTGHAMAMKYGRALDKGAIIYRNGGKFYLIEDRKMTNGQMLYSSMSSWTNDRLLLGHN